VTVQHPQAVPCVPPDPKTSIDAVFAGGGEMGALMRSIDWAASPLGPVALWSQALRTTVGLLLRSRFPMLLWWGPRFVQFYNDAYIPIPGTKHPKALGQPASECWGEIWHIIGPMIQAPYSGHAATWSDDLFLLINRKGFLEETHFKVAYSPVPDGAVSRTGVGGVLATVAETTEQVYGERQLKTLRELGARADAKTPEEACETAAATFDENAFDVPFALFYLLEPDGKRARLASSCGFEVQDGPSNPGAIDLDAPAEEQAWPLSRIVNTRAVEVVTDAGARLGSLPTGEWSQSPRYAIGLPLFSPAHDRPYGVLLAGCNPHRDLDDGYRTFFELAAAQVVTAIRNAKAYEEQRSRAEKLAEIDRVKTAFFSNVSHEFRTPLTLILGPLDELLRSPLPPERAREELRVVHRNGLRLLKLVNTLLDFSRMEAGRVEAVYEPTDLALLTADLASVFRSAIERGGLRFVVDCAPLPEPVHVDREMWEKIVLNLLSNAFKFTFQGEIAVGVRAVGPDVELSVRDTGVGISEEDVPHIFERFHRAKGSRARTHEGTGIGLALVQELVKLLGGAIHADSVEGRGTTMTVSIPRGTAHLPGNHLEGRRRLASTATGARPYIEEALRWLPDDDSDDAGDDDVPLLQNFGPTIGDAGWRPYILCADDNADMRDYVTRLLRAHYEVETVADGELALRAVRRRMPDLLISDVMMPGIDGFQLLRALREDPATKALPILLLSARAGEQSHVEGLRAGADDYLVKPFSSREMLARVGAHLEIARVRKELVRKEYAARTAIEAGEEERRRISRELHDEIGQELTALVLGLRSARDASAADVWLDLRLEHLQGVAEEIGKNMHRIAVELRPPALDAVGLQAAVSNYADVWGKRHGIQVDFEGVGLGSGRLPPYIEATIYRIVQEALTNVSKHAGATTVNVVLQRDAGQIVTIVEDNGRGFDTAAAPRTHGSTAPLGILGMRERAALVGGSLTIESQPSGTTVFVRIPFPTADGRTDA
jgi:signal transduction histidine kinase/GAF domain-containing protein